LVIGGKADPALLDSYAAERMPVARRLLSTTDRMFSFVVSDTAAAGFFRTNVLPHVLATGMRVGPLRQLFFRAISQIGIRYRESPLSQTLPELPKAAPQAGDRFPWVRLKLSPNGAPEDLFRVLDDTRFALLVFGQTAPAGSVRALGDMLSVHVVPDDPANER